MKNVKKAILAASILVSGHVSAATVSWGTSSTNVNVNDVFTINITGSNFINNVDGGGVNVSFNQNVLNIQSVSINESVWDFGGFGISTGTLDNLSGTLNGIMVNTFANVSGDFVIASIEMKVIAQGNSLLSLSEYALNPWASGGSLINPDFVDASVDVALATVPVPAAAWLFASGLLLISSITRHRNIQL